MQAQQDKFVWTQKSIILLANEAGVEVAGDPTQGQVGDSYSEINILS